MLKSDFFTDSDRFLKFQKMMPIHISEDFHITDKDKLHRKVRT